MLSVILVLFSGFYFFRLTSWIHVADDDGCAYFCTYCVNFFVRSLDEFILGWRCLWIHVAANDKCSVEVGETVLAVRLVEAWALKKTQMRQSI